MKIDCFVVSLSATLIAHMTVCLLASLYIVSLSHSLLLLLLLLLLLRMVGGMAKRGVLGGTESMGLGLKGAVCSMKAGVGSGIVVEKNVQLYVALANNNTASNHKLAHIPEAKGRSVAVGDRESCFGQINNENLDPGNASAEPLLGVENNLGSSAITKRSIASASRCRIRHDNRHCRRFFMSREIFAVSACVFFSFLLFPFATFANAAATEEPPPSPFASMSNDLSRLKELSSNMNGLRGSSNAAAGLVPIFQEFKDILQNHIASMQSMERMLEEEDIDGVAHAVRTLLSDTKLLSLVTQDTKDIELQIEGKDGVVIKDMEDDGSSLANIPDLVRDIPSASIVDVLRKEDFQDLTENLINIARNLDSVDLSFLAGKNGRRLNKDRHRQWEQEREPVYDTKSEEHNYYDFGGEYYSNFFSPNRHGFTPSNRQLTKMRSRMGGKLKSVMKAARRNRRLSRNKFFNYDDNDGRKKRRLQAEGSNQWCQEECSIDDPACNCEKLFKCIKRMSVYDAAVLFASGFIVTDMNDEKFANLTTDDLNLYDVGKGGLYRKFLAIQQNANGPTDEEQCTNLLMEMHSPCDSTSKTCSNTNSQSYQLTVDQVCDEVNTDTKLYFEAIFNAYSIKPYCLLVTTGPYDWSEGTLEVSVNSGYGYVKVTPSEVTFFSPNEIVVDECFASIEGVQVKNPTNNGWDGYIEVSSDNKKTYSSLICADSCDCDTCTSNCNCGAGCSSSSCSNSWKTIVVVDGDNDGNYGADIKCTDGLTCTFKLPIDMNPRKFSCVEFLLLLDIILQLISNFDSKSISSLQQEIPPTVSVLFFLGKL
jgi:hypothetical protein